MGKLILALLFLSTSILATDFGGNWAGEGVAQGQAHPLFIMIKQDGKTVTGTAGPDAARQQAFQNGKVDGDRITFEIIAPDGNGYIHFDLKTDADGLKGTLQVKHDASTLTVAASLKKAIV